MLPEMSGIAPFGTYKFSLHLPNVYDPFLIQIVAQVHDNASALSRVPSVENAPLLDEKIDKYRIQRIEARKLTLTPPALKMIDSFANIAWKIDEIESVPDTMIRKLPCLFDQRNGVIVPRLKGSDPCAMLANVPLCDPRQSFPKRLIVTCEVYESSRHLFFTSHPTSELQVAPRRR